jgi:uncharacterized protein
MPNHDGAWPQGTPCWVDAQLDDPTSARAFYSDLFGWAFEEGPPETGGYLMAMLNGRPAAGLGPKPPDTQMRSVWTTYLAAESADDIHAKIIAAGGQPAMDPFDVMDVGRMFVAADPTGAVFGVWEAKARSGAEIYNEPGGYTWNEVHTRDYPAARAFYTAVFGYTYTEIGDGQTLNYSTFSVPGGTDSVGGINDLTKMPGDTPPHWLAWFDVSDCDESVAKAEGRGGFVMVRPQDSPFGRQALITGQQGEAFGIIDPARRVGEPPPPRS